MFNSFQRRQEARALVEKIIRERLSDLITEFEIGPERNYTDETMTDITKDIFLLNYWLDNYTEE